MESIEISNLKFKKIQDKYRNAKGEKGIRLRSIHYKPFFLKFGKDIYIDEGCYFTQPNLIVLDDFVRINRDTKIYGSGGVWIGRHVLVGPNCFIHSANHIIKNSSEAIYEKGYLKEKVFIGDLSLISANVSILPGANIGNGSFMACGAIVTKGNYQEGSILKGVPAKNEENKIESKIKSTPDIVILTNNEIYWNKLANHIITALGLPQVEISNNPKLIPESAHSVLIFGPEDWNPIINNKKIWRIKNGEIFINDNDLPKYRSSPIFHKKNEFFSFNNIASYSTHWILNRLRKKTLPLGFKDYKEWQISLEIIKNEFKNEEFLHYEFHKFTSKRNDLFINSLKSPIYFWRKKIFKKPILYKEIMLNPHILVEASLRGLLDRELLKKFIKRMGTKGLTGLRLISFSLAAILIRDEHNAEKLLSIIKNENWLIAGTFLLKSSKNKDIACTSPLTLALWVIAGKEGYIEKLLPENFEGLLDKKDKIDWKGFNSGKFYDSSKKIISNSLIINWIKLHTLSIPKDSEFLLTDESYKVSTKEIEQIWFEIFRNIQDDLPLIKLKPWPSNCKAAISLRYDVDRQINTKNINELLKIQSELINSPCGAWYYFSKEPSLDRQSKQLEAGWQEIGLHHNNNDDKCCGLGVSHHSSPQSRYWEGDNTSNFLANKGALYGEFLANNIQIPKIALNINAKKPLSDFWLLPLHFPLEGDTKGENLDYFEERLKYLKEIISLDGLVIIGSHPDIPSKLLKKLIKKKFLKEKIWFTTPIRAIERIEKIMKTGSIKVIKDKKGISLLSNSYLADVAFEIWHPFKKLPEINDIQLIKGKPRYIKTDYL